MTGTPTRYVVLRHEGIAEPHFDLMIESAAGGPLMTWRCDGWPVSTALLCRLPDHRRHYLDYQGPLGGGRGTVRRVAAGHASWSGDPMSRVVVHFLDSPIIHTVVLHQIGVAETWQAERV